MSTPSYQKDEVKYHMLRNQLDKLKYLQTLDYSSMDLVEAMLNDILSYKRKLKTNEDIITEQKEKTDSLILGIAAYKHQNHELFKENSELHNEILSLLEKQNFNGKDLEMKRLNDDTNAIKFLLNKAKETNSKLQSEIVEVKQRYIALVVDIYEKKVDMQKIFSEIESSESLNIKPRTLESFGRSGEINEHNNNTEMIKFNNSTNINNTMSNNNLGVGTNIRAKGNKELIEKIFNLENEIKEKNKEIDYLKKSRFTENIMEQKVVIDYLKSELSNVKEKYECYLKFQMDKNEKLLTGGLVQKKKIKKQFNTNDYDQYEDVKKAKKVQMSQSNLQMRILERDLKQMKAKYESLQKENELLRKEMGEIVEKYNSSKNYIQNELEKEFTAFSDKNRKSQGIEINLLTSLTQKLKETECNLNSAQQHYKNQMNELNKVNITLTNENKKLKSSLKKNDKAVNDYKEIVNKLNQKIFQLQSSLNNTINSNSPNKLLSNNSA